jgi:hypothetical protein
MRLFAGIAVAKTVKTQLILVRVGGLCFMCGDFNRCAVSKQKERVLDLRSSTRKNILAIDTLQYR